MPISCCLWDMVFSFGVIALDLRWVLFTSKVFFVCFFSSPKIIVVFEMSEDGVWGGWSSFFLLFLYKCSLKLC